MTPSPKEERQAAERGQSCDRAAGRSAALSIHLRIWKDGGMTGEKHVCFGALRVR